MRIHQLLITGRFAKEKTRITDMVTKNYYNKTTIEPSIDTSSEINSKHLININDIYKFFSSDCPEVYIG